SDLRPDHGTAPGASYPGPFPQSEDAEMTSTPHTPRAARRDDAAAHAADRLLLDALRHSSGRAVAICLLTIAAAAGGLALPAALGRALDLMLAHGGGPDALRWIRICVALTLLLV